MYIANQRISMKELDNFFYRQAILFLLQGRIQCNSFSKESTSQGNLDKHLTFVNTLCWCKYL